MLLPFHVSTTNIGSVEFKSGKEELKICSLCSLWMVYSVCPKTIGKKKGLKQSKSSSALHGGYETVGASQDNTQKPHRIHIISEVRKLQTMQ